MSDGRFTIARAWLVAATLVGAGAVGRAQSAGVSSSTETVGKGEGLSAAKKDFDALKANRDPALSPKGELPRVNGPEWYGTGAGNATPARPNSTSNKKAATEKKSANWLVDAMQKPAERRDALAPGQRDVERDGTRSGASSGDDVLADPSPPSELTTSAQTPSPRAQKSDAPTMVKEAVVNPLTTYLGEWMSPQDYALLKPGLTPSSDSVLGKGGTLPSVGPAAVNASAVPFSVPGLAGAAAPTISATPRENPYLQPLSLPAPAGIAMPSIAAPPPPPLASVPPPVQTSAPPIVSEPAPAKIPDFARPASDDKYFKQLKRF